MIVTDILSQLRRDEELRLAAYPDPLTGGAPWTIGYGCTGPNITSSTVWTQSKAEFELKSRVFNIQTQLAADLPWFSSLSDPRAGVLVNMAYQQGVDGLLKYHKTLAAFERKDWPFAASEMLDSLWARQTPARAQRLSLQVCNDTWQ